MDSLLELRIAGGHRHVSSPTMRYELMLRIFSSCRKRSTPLIAWGIGEDGIQLLVRTDPTSGRQLARGIKTGTTRSCRNRGHDLVWCRTRVIPVADHAKAIASCHAVYTMDGFGSAVASPWSSHRDLLGLRITPHYSPALALHCTTAEAICAELQEDVVRPTSAEPPVRPSMHKLMRAAAAAHGVLPADRRSFGTFAQLAGRTGWRNIDVADALNVTPRRVRQLKQRPSRHTELALYHIVDPRLAA